MKKLVNKQNTPAATPEYPYSTIVDNPGDNTGTPFDREVYTDIHQLMEKSVAEWEALGFDFANGLPDNATNSFQLWEAFQSNSRIATMSLRAMLAQSIIGGTFVDVNVPHAIFGLFNDGNSVGAGFIYYQNDLFFCAGLDYGGTVNDTLVYNITDENLITLTDTASGTGAFDDSALLRVGKTKPQYAMAPLNSKSYPGGFSYQLVDIGNPYSDDFGMVDVAGDRFKPKRAGYYEFRMSFNFTKAVVSSPPNLIRTAIRKNGSVIYDFLPVNMVANDRLITVHGDYIVYLDGVNDYIDFTAHLEFNAGFDLPAGLIVCKYLPNG